MTKTNNQYNEDIMTIIDAIHLGLRRGYNRNLQFRNKWVAFEDRMTEYLLTIHVANELHEYTEFGELTSIELEYSLQAFYNNAFPEAIWTNENQLFMDSEYLRREYEASASQRRIDIAVMYDDRSGIFSNYRSLHGVEIKAINTSYVGVLSDVGRLSESMITPADRTGTNSIVSCYSAFIKSYSNGKKPTRKTEIEGKRKQTLDRIEMNLKDQFRDNPKYEGLEYTIHPCAVDSSSFEEYYEHHKDIPDFDLGWDPESETGEVLGVVIEITRKKK